MCVVIFSNYLLIRGVCAERCMGINARGEFDARLSATSFIMSDLVGCYVCVCVCRIFSNYQGDVDARGYSTEPRG